MTSVFPPNVLEATVTRALDAIAAALGAGGVLKPDEDLTSYADPYAFGNHDEFVPSAVIMPRSVEDIQAVLAIANEYKLPLWTVSQGRNYAYGGAAPRLSGSVILDLKRMNNVLEVNEECGYVVVEPGVRFFDLDAHLRAGGYKLWASVPELGWGSVIGNALERGFGYTSYGDHSQQQCGMEVVLANGDVMRTGMGAMTNNTAWQLYKGGYGPASDGLFMQSNLGIVTKMGLWLMPRPSRAIACTLKVRHEADLELLIDTLRPLLLDETIQSNVQVGSVLAIASMLSSREQWFDGEGPLPDTAIEAVAKKFDLGRWTAKFGLYGSEELTDARLSVVRKAVASIPNAELSVRSYPGDVAPEQVHPADRTQLGVPGMDGMRMAAWRGGEPAHTDFSLVCPPTGRDAIKQMQLIRKRVEQFGFDYAGGFTLNRRHAIALCLLSFDKNNLRQATSVAALFPLLVHDAAQQGYAPYRSHLAFMDLIADQYDFNNHAAMRFNQTLKAALDPNGILSPGKQGIWPHAMENFRNRTGA